MLLEFIKQAAKNAWAAMGEGAKKLADKTPTQIDDVIVKQVFTTEMFDAFWGELEKYLGGKQDPQVPAVL